MHCCDAHAAAHETLTGVYGVLNEALEEQIKAGRQQALLGNTTAWGITQIRIDTLRDLKQRLTDEI